MFRTIISWILTLSLLISLAACSAPSDSSSPSATDPSSSESPVSTVTAPGNTSDSSEASEEPTPFGAFSVTDLEGNAVDESIFGNVDLTMVNVWGTFCSPCLREMPFLGELSTEYADSGFQIIGVVTDVLDQSGNLVESQVETARSLVEETGAHYPHLLPTLEMYTQNLKDVIYIPETFFVDREGNVVSRHTGSLDKESWKTLIDEMLAEVQS